MALCEMHKIRYYTKMCMFTVDVYEKKLTFVMASGNLPHYNVHLQGLSVLTCTRNQPSLYSHGLCARGFQIDVIRGSN